MFNRLVVEISRIKWVYSFIFFPQVQAIRVRGEVEKKVMGGTRNLLGRFPPEPVRICYKVEEGLEG